MNTTKICKESKLLHMRYYVYLYTVYNEFTMILRKHLIKDFFIYELSH